MGRNSFRTNLLSLALIAGNFLHPTIIAAQTVPAPTEKQLAAIEKRMVPQRKKVTDILEADKSGYRCHNALVQYFKNPTICHSIKNHVIDIRQSKPL